MHILGIILSFTLLNTYLAPQTQTHMVEHALDYKVHRVSRI